MIVILRREPGGIDNDIGDANGVVCGAEPSGSDKQQNLFWSYGFNDYTETTGGDYNETGVTRQIFTEAHLNGGVEGVRFGLWV